MPLEIIYLIIWSVIVIAIDIFQDGIDKIDTTSKIIFNILFINSKLFLESYLSFTIFEEYKKKNKNK